MKRQIATLLAIALGLATLPVAGADSGALRVKVAAPLLVLGQKWADAYAAGHPPTKIEITAGPTPEAFTALAARQVGVGLAPRAIRYKEVQACEAALGQRPVEFKVAVNGAAVYVNPSNAIAALTYDELEAIFRGKYRNWKQVGGPDAPIIVFGVATNTPAGELFGEEVLGGKTVTNDVRLVAPTELLSAIAAAPNAIGFGPLFKLENVRGLPLKRSYSSTPVEPSPEAIANRIYPISRFVFCYLSPEASQGEAKAWAEWMRSDAGQQAAVEAGFFALPAKWRATP